MSFIGSPFRLELRGICYLSATLAIFVTSYHHRKLETMTTKQEPRIVKKLETGLTAEFTTPPLLQLRLACCLLHHAYSTPIEGETGGGLQGVWIGRHCWRTSQGLSIRHCCCVTNTWP